MAIVDSGTQDPDLDNNVATSAVVFDPVAQHVLLGNRAMMDLVISGLG